ncbi:MAG TPA: DUF4350 domain-containing protein [Flavitalea sp.]|nr:DUF4350 domain-containing protein [Flavitalea sp.]
MNARATYRLLGLCLFIIGIAGCGGRMNERFSLGRKDKIPYGAYYAFNNLSSLFPQAEIKVSESSPASYQAFDFDEERIQDIETEGSDDEAATEKPGQRKRSALIVITNTMSPTEREIDALFDFVRSGNDVFISAMAIGDNLLDSLRLKAPPLPGFFNDKDSLSVKILHPVSKTFSSYSYPGKAMDSYFSLLDSSIAAILGQNEKGQPNFVRFTLREGGSLYLHLAPAAFTNFFLLHKENKAYFDQALSYLPAHIDKVYWDDYFRFHVYGKNKPDRNAFSKLQALLKHESLRWALWLAALLFALIYFFESKRKQKVIPVTPLLNNTSLDFVKTIGRLYFQRKDNKNLATKMTLHFMEYARNRYRLTGSPSSPEFADRLAYKSGRDVGEIRDLLYDMNALNDAPSVTDDELLELNAKLDKFYKRD